MKKLFFTVALAACSILASAQSAVIPVAEEPTTEVKTDCLPNEANEEAYQKALKKYNSKMAFSLKFSSVFNRKTPYAFNSKKLKKSS